MLRGGYGIIYVNLQNSLLDGEITAFQQYSVTIRNPSYPDPYQGKDPLSFVSTAPPNITIGANDLRNALAQTASVGFSQQLGGNFGLHLDGVYSRIDDYPNRVNINTPDPRTGLRPLPEWGQIVQSQPSQGTFDYTAFLARLEKRYSDRYLYTVSYTLAKQVDSWTGKDGNSTGSITNVFHPEDDRGPADTDRRHNLAASGSVALPLTLQLSAVWTLRSSLPFSAQAGRDLNNDGFTTDYVPGTTKNQGNRNLDLSLVNAWRGAERPQANRRQPDRRDTLQPPGRPAEQGHRARQQPEARADRPGVQPARHGQPRWNRHLSGHQRAVRLVRARPLGPAAAAGGARSSNRFLTARSGRFTGRPLRRCTIQ